MYNNRQIEELSRMLLCWRIWECQEVLKASSTEWDVFIVEYWGKDLRGSRKWSLCRVEAVLQSVNGSQQRRGLSRPIVLGWVLEQGLSLLFCTIENVQSYNKRYSVYSWRWSKHGFIWQTHIFFIYIFVWNTNMSNNFESAVISNHANAITLNPSLENGFLTEPREPRHF